MSDPAKTRGLSDGTTNPSDQGRAIEKTGEMT